MTWRQRPVAWWLAGRDVQLVQLHQRVAGAVAGERGHGRDEVRDVAGSHVCLEGVEVLVDLVQVEPARVAVVFVRNEGEASRLTADVGC